MSQHASSTNADRPEPTCKPRRKPVQYRNQCRQLERQKEQAEGTQNNAGNKNSGANIFIPKIDKNNNNNNKNNKRAERKPTTVYPLCETCEKTNQSTQNCYFVVNAANGPPPRNRKPEGQNQVPQRDNQNNSNESAQTAAQIDTSNARPSLQSCN